MNEEIENALQTIREKYQIMQQELQKIDAQRNEIIAEMLRLDGAFREMNKLIAPKEDGEQNE